MRFAYDVTVLGITVAALMTTAWIARHLIVPAGTDLVLIPGLCEGDPACAHACPTAAIEYREAATVDWLGDFARERTCHMLQLEGARLLSAGKAPSDARGAAHAPRPCTPDSHRA